MSEIDSPSAPEPGSDPPEKNDDSPEVSPDAMSPTIPGGRNPELDGLDPRELIEGGLQSRSNPSAWEPPTPEDLHRLLPQYEIDALIGRGGMGAVYRGRQATLDRRVAIKLLPAEIAADAEFVARFEREARTLAKLHHPGIVLVHDFGQTDEGHLYFVMEFVDGTDLYKIINGPGLDCAQALEIVGQICDALQYAHSEGVVHRDIKPANVILGLDGRAKLADFGLARPTDDGSGVFTRTNVVMGTPDYMAPEALAGEADHRADLYSLGVMLYEMLTGKPPRGAWATPSERVQVDVRLDEVVVRAMQEDPELRYQQASEIGTDVEAIRTTPLQGVAKAKKKSMAAAKKAEEEKKKKPAGAKGWLIGVGVVVLAALAWGVSQLDFRSAGEEMENSIGMKMCWIPTGKFVMGDEKKKVELTKGFWIGKYEVTQAEYKEVIGTNLALYQSVGMRAPVERVSWLEAMDFCEKLTERERKTGSLPEGWKYTLPTGAQWEYACRAGTKGDYNVDGASLDELGWYKDNSGDTPHPVGEKMPNAWGLHDMHGNVWEWCADWHAETLVSGKDPTGPEKGESRVARGGCWADGADLCRSALRRGRYPDHGLQYYGLRVAMVPSEEVERSEAGDAGDAKEAQPLPEVLAARERGGRLRVFGRNGLGLAELGGTAEFSDFQTVVIGDHGWAVRRSNGDTYIRANMISRKDAAPVKLGPYTTEFLMSGRNPVMKMTDNGAFRNVFGEDGSQYRPDLGHPDVVAFLNPGNHVLGLAKDGSILVSQSWWPGHETGYYPVPTDYFLGAMAYSAVNGYYLSARPNLPVRSFNLKTGEVTEFPTMIGQVVEMNTNGDVAILRNAAGEVFVMTPEGTSYGTAPEDLGPSIAVRVGPSVFAAQMTDGSWRAWGDSIELVAQTARIGHAIDLDFWSKGPGKSAYMMWIEPVEEENPDGPESDRQHTGPLGHTYVPVDGLANVLFSTWETRVKDFEAFVKETGHDMSGLVNANSSLSWQNPGFEQTGDHPVVLVNRGDANAYCRWLTEKERAAGRLLPGQVYRLPTDREWSAAMGVLDEKGDFPSEREFPDNVFTWPRGTPPPHNAENLRWTNDDFQHTAPVGSGIANQFGIYDLLGNVEEVCADPWSINPMAPSIVVRGSAYNSEPKVSRFNVRGIQGEVRMGSPTQGFRCVLDLKNEKQRAIQLQMEKAVSSLHELSILQNKPSREISSLVTDEFVLLDLSQWNHLNQEESKRLEGLPLTHLMFITGDSNGDLGFMKTLPLEVVLMKMHPHANFEKLTANLAGLPLTHVTIEHHPDLAGGVESLDFLRGASLRQLHLQNFRNLRDMDALRGMPLEILSLRYSAIPDLTPLRDAPMKSISLEPKVPSLEMFLDGLEWWDQNVFANVPVKQIASRSLGAASTSWGRARVAELVAETEARMKAIPYLQSREASESITPVLQEQLRFATSVANWLDGEPGSLANDSRTHGNHAYLLTPWELDFDSASEFARALGAHLVTITTPEENAFVSQMLDEVDTRVEPWLGLVQKGKGREGWEWETGEAVAIHNWATERSGMTEVGTADVARLGVGKTEIGRPWKHWSRSSSLRVLLEWDTPVVKPPVKPR